MRLSDQIAAEYLACNPALVLDIQNKVKSNYSLDVLIHFGISPSISLVMLHDKLQAIRKKFIRK